MRLIKASYSSVQGNLHTQFFGMWLRTAWDYPSAMNAMCFDTWRLPQPVYGEIASSHSAEPMS